MLPLDFVRDVCLYWYLIQKGWPKFQTFPYSHKYSRSSTSLMPQKPRTKYTPKLIIHNIKPNETLL
jgi:hypothetical protein